jgi:hypothetical protein
MTVDLTARLINLGHDVLGTCWHLVVVWPIWTC